MLIFCIIIVIVAVFIIYLFIDYYGPKEIVLKSGNAKGLNFQRAKELIVQEMDEDGNLWASQGMTLYCLKNGDNKFTRILHVPTGFSYFWLNNFSLFRRFTNKPECIEATITKSRHIIVMSAGVMWHCKVNQTKFKRTFKLPSYGLGVGRGIFSNGLLSTGDDIVYFGEYFRNTDRGPVRVYKSEDSGLSWSVVFEFKENRIRHIHALQKDPYSERFWICTGDDDNEAIIAWSDNGFRTITQIGQGSQVWRTCQLVFTEEAVYWGTDTGSIDLAGIYRWDRKTMEVDKLIKSNGAILFGTRLTGGTIIFSTDREGFPNEHDKKTRLFVVNGNTEISEIECGTWKHWEKGLKYSFAMLRMQRNQGNRSLFISVINQKEYPIGEIIMLSENEILSHVTR